MTDPAQYTMNKKAVLDALPAWNEDGLTFQEMAQKVSLPEDEVHGILNGLCSNWLCDGGRGKDGQTRYSKRRS